MDAYVGSRLRQAQIIDASNVADFYYARSNHTDWDPYHDFPNVAPPFPLFWVEMRCPQVLLNDSTRKTEGSLPFAFGCLVEVQRGEPGRRTLRDVTASPLEGTEQLLEELAPTLVNLCKEKSTSTTAPRCGSISPRRRSNT